jgi:TPR repeat protein
MVLPAPTFGLLKRKVTAKRSKLALKSPKGPRMPQKKSLAEEVVQYRETAAKSSNPEIQMEFAVFCIESSNSVEDLDDKSTYLLEGFAWLKRLSSAGYTEAQFYLGNAYRDDEQYDRAYTQYSLAAKKLHPGSGYHAGLAKENGVGTKKDLRGALELFKKSATNGYVPAMYKLGMCFTVCIHLVSLINLERRSVVQTKTPRSN